MKTYSHTRTLDHALCDHRGEPRLSALLAAAQQISMEHCDAAGVGGGFFWERGYAFLLAKLRLEIVRMPRGGEVVSLHSRPNLPVRAQYRRQTRMEDAAGNTLVTVDSRWVLVDIASRRLLRNLPQGIELPFLDAEEMPDLRPAQPPRWEETEVAPVRYTMLDINRHVNNTVYGDLICNQLEQSLLADRRLGAVDIFYHREALPGDSIRLQRHQEGDRFFVRGLVGESVCFEANGVLEAV